MPLDLALDDLLRWYLDAGVDEAIGEVPVDRFAASAKPVAAVRPQPAAEPQPIVTAVPATVGPAAVIHATATHIAAGCASLAELRTAMEAFDGLALKRTAHATVFADGNPEAALMVIGEAPGQEEDRAGRPFVGKSGQLLDRMLASIGFSRDTNAYITNVLPWRPLENRKPTPDEVAVCLPFVARHIELVDPQVILLLGGAAASAILARNDGINRLRGRWSEYCSPGLSRPVATLATFHPAYLLRTPDAKRGVWRDLLMVKKRLDSHP